MKAKEFIEAIERPLKYVHEGDPKRITVVKNLSDHIRATSRHALSQELPEPEVRLFRSLQELFSGYEELEDDKKRGRIQQALKLIRPERRVTSLRQYRAEDHLLIKEDQLKQALKKLETDVQFLKGVGPALAAKFSRAGIQTISELLTFFPVRHEDRRHARRLLSRA